MNDPPPKGNEQTGTFCQIHQAGLLANVIYNFAAVFVASTPLQQPRSKGDCKGKPKPTHKDKHEDQGIEESPKRSSSLESPKEKGCCKLVSHGKHRSSAACSNGSVRSRQKLNSNCNQRETKERGICGHVKLHAQSTAAVESHKNK